MRIDKDVVRTYLWRVESITSPAMTDDDLEEGDVVIIRHTGKAAMWNEGDPAGQRFVALSQAKAGEVVSVLAAPPEIFSHHDSLRTLANS